MVTQELLAYIRQQISLGKSKDDITSLLTNGGSWMRSDVDEAFGLIAPVPIITTVPTPPATGVLPNTPPAIAATPSRFPYAILGIVAFGISLAATYFSIKDDYQALTPKIMLGVAAFGVLSVLVLHALTALYKMVNRSFSRALFMAFVPGLVLYGLQILIAQLGLASQAVSGGLALVSIVAWVTVFARVYGTLKRKAFWVGVWQSLIMGIIAIVIFFFVGLQALFNLGSILQSVSSTISPTSTETADPLNPEPVATLTPNTDVCTTSTTPWIKLAPVSGTFKVGDTVIVTWRSCNIPATEIVGIGITPQVGDGYPVSTSDNTGATTFEIYPYYLPGPYSVHAYPGVSGGTVVFNDETDATLTIVK